MKKTLLASLTTITLLALHSIPDATAEESNGQHLAFDTERNYPLPDLYVSMLQRMGIEADKFATSTGTMRGLEFA